MAFLVNRTSAAGDVTVSAWISADVVAPNAGRFWTVS